jgi:hypothetical protein
MRLICNGLAVLFLLMTPFRAAGAQSGKLDIAYLCGIDGSCVYTPLVAQRYEMVVSSECGAWHDRLKSDNPNVMTFLYISGTDNYTTPNDIDWGWYYGPRKHAWMKWRCQQLGYSPEILYMHYYDNTVVSGHSIPGTYSATLTDADSVSRVPVYLGYYQGSGIGRILLNFSHPITRQLLIEYAKKAWTDPNAGHDWPKTSTWDGYYIDNWLANELHPGMGQIGTITSGGRLVEHPTHAVNGSTEVVAWFQELMHLYSRSLRDTLHNGASWSPDGKAKYLAGNIANTWTDDFARPSVSGLDYLVQEFQYSPVRNYAANIPQAYSRDSACAANGIYPCYCALQTMVPSSGSGELTLGEACMGNLAWYYCTRGANTYLFQMNGNPSNYWIDEGAVNWDTLSWRGCMEFDVGSFLGRVTLHASGNDPTGQEYAIYKRDYANALVFVRPRIQWNHNITPQTAVTITLPTAYRALQIDGSLGPLNTSFSIKNGCGLILAKSGGQTWISPPIPTSPANGGVVQSLQPTLSVANAYDPESRSLQYEFQVDPTGDFAGSDLLVSSAGEIFAPNPSTTAWMVSQPLTDGATCYWRCRVVTTSGDPATSDWSTVVSFSILMSSENTCPTPPTASQPANGSLLSDTTPDLVVVNSTDDDGDPLTYDFAVAADAGFGNIIAAVSSRPSGSGSTSWTVAPALPAGHSYYWKARAFDGQCYGGWSASFSFSITGVNTCPTPPAASAPANGSQTTSQTPTLVINNGTDLDGDVLFYDFQVSAYAGFDAVVASVSGHPQGTGTTSWTVSPPLSNGQGYYWRARAYDGQCYGGWSPTFSFTVVSTNSCPIAPAAYSPAHGIQTSDRTPELVVYNSSDADGDALTYEFQISTYSSFNVLTASRAGISAGEGMPSWTVDPPLTIGLAYYWRVRAFDGVCYGGWSAVRWLGITGVNLPPSIPVGVFPIAGDTVTCVDLKLTVQNVRDPENDQIWYQYLLYDNGVGIDIEDNIPQDPGSVTSWEPSAKLKKNRVYTWRVQCHDPVSYSGWSGHYPFYYANAAPTIPELFSPTDGERVFTMSVDLTVGNAEDPDGDPLTYEFQIWADEELTELAEEVAGISPQSYATIWTTEFTPENNATYWWRARAVDGTEPGQWSAVWSFTNSWFAVDVEGIVPELVSPAAGSTVRTTRPRFEVRVPAAALGEKCEISIFTPKKINETYAYSGELDVSSGIVTWIPEHNLGTESMYYWQARLVGGEWSQRASFVVRPDIHFAPNPYSLAQGGAVTIRNLPADATVRIYTISGKLVTTLVNDDQTELQWDLTNDAREHIGPGVYLFTVHSASVTTEGKFAVAP